MNFDIIDSKRRQLRYTITEFCERIGIDRKTYYNMQSNPDSIKIGMLNKMADLLELSKTERKQLLP